MFVAKLDPAGAQLLYSTFLGGSGNDNSTNIGLDAQGNLYIAGNTNSISTSVYPPNGKVNYPVSTSAFQGDVAEIALYSWAAFITKLSPDLHTILYSSIISGQNPRTGSFSQAMAVGQNGIVYVGGFTNSASFPVTPGAFQAGCAIDPNNHCYDAGFISAFDTTRSGPASLVFSTYVNGTYPIQSASQVRGLAVDGQNNVYATGQTSARDFPTTPGALAASCTFPGDTNFCEDAFVLSLSPAGSLNWSTYYGAGVRCCTVSGTAIALDANGNVYVAGQTGGAYDLPQINAFPPGQKGFQDVFLLTLSGDGSQVLFGSYFGGTGDDIPLGLALDGNNNIYFAGYSNSSDLPVTPGAVQTGSPGPGFRQGFFGKVSAVSQ